MPWSSPPTRGCIWRRAYPPSALCCISFLADRCFYYRIGTITVKNGGVELIGVMQQMENRGLKEGLIRAIFRPAIVPFIHVGVMEFVAMGVELGPRHASMEDIQDVVKDFVERQFRLWPFFGLFQMGV